MNRLDSFPIVKGQVFIQDDSVGWIPINSLPQRDTFYWSYDYLRCFLLGNGQIEGIFTGPVKYHIMCKYFNPRIINDSTTQFDGFSFSSKSLMEHTFVTQPDTTMVLIDSMTIDVDLRNGFLMRQYQSKRNKPVVNGGMMPPINKPVPIIYKKVVLNE
ncbi:MAG: hypothetical protein GC181_10550 [Bacteroidetes bacterium]|nr:hypothetical protein [Bacteroidota bacterium]